MTTVFRVHPSIGVARLGSSNEYLLAPESLTGSDDGSEAGGLPINPANHEVATAKDLRDKHGKLKRQAARFKIFAYDSDSDESYPNGGGTEVRVGSQIGEKFVSDIIWTVHLANKKANNYQVSSPLGRKAFEDGKFPQLRNAALGSDLEDVVRRKWLIIDPGPRAVSGLIPVECNFDNDSVATYSDSKGKIVEIEDYPKSFPNDIMKKLYAPSGNIETLGELKVEGDSRLLVIGAFGKAVSLYNMYGNYYRFNSDTNNDGWFDDSADGPVNARIVFTDGSVIDAHGGWVNCVDPSYAPQIRNVVSTWDDVYDTFVRELDLKPNIYQKGFKESYCCSFKDEVHPIFRACEQVKWVANIPPIAESAHDAVGAIGPKDDPERTIMAGLVFIRNPNKSEEDEAGVPLMPLSLGDSGKSFLSVTKTQYFALSQWNNGSFNDSSEKLGEGELLDKVSLVSCLGGRYVPGIEFSYLVRDKDIYEQDWRNTGGGPFRIKQAALDYSKVGPTPFLNSGWIPVHSGNKPGLEPGDMSKFLAIPWHTDYNSCSVHQTAFNHSFDDQSFASDRNALFFSWPAQRPVAVYPASHYRKGEFTSRAYSIRGPGTQFESNDTMSTFQDPLDSLVKWDNIGIVIQAHDKGKATNIFLEHESRLTERPAIDWPFSGKLPV